MITERNESPGRNVAQGASMVSKQAGGAAGGAPPGCRRELLDDTARRVRAGRSSLAVIWTPSPTAAGSTAALASSPASKCCAVWQRTSTASRPITIRLVDWADEEGARFGRSLFGSSAFAGTHTIQADRGRTDRDGIRLEDALRECHVDIDRIGDAGYERAHAGAYLELHIEQGPVLEAHAAAAGRGARHQGRGTPRDHLPRAGGTFRVHADGCAPGCAGRRGQACAGDSTHCAEASGRGGDHGEREDFSRAS